MDSHQKHESQVLAPRRKRSKKEVPKLNTEEDEEEPKSEKQQPSSSRAPPATKMSTLIEAAPPGVPDSVRGQVRRTLAGLGIDSVIEHQFYKDFMNSNDCVKDGHSYLAFVTLRSSRPTTSFFWETKKVQLTKLHEGLATRHRCPKCGLMNAVWWQQDNRASDEGGFTMIQCVNCLTVVKQR